MKKQVFLSGLMGAFAFFKAACEEKKGAESLKKETEAEKPAETEKIYVKFDSDKILCSAGSRFSPEPVENGMWVSEGDFVKFTSKEVFQDSRNERKTDFWLINGRKTEGGEEALSFEKLQCSDAVLEDDKYTVTISVVTRETIKPRVSFDEEQVICKVKDAVNNAERQIFSGEKVSEGDRITFSRKTLKDDGEVFSTYMWNDIMGTSSILKQSVTKEITRSLIEDGKIRFSFNINKKVL